MPPVAATLPAASEAKTGCVKISYLTLGSDLLTVFVHQKDHLGRRVHTESGQDGFDLVILLLTEQNRRVCH